MNITRLKAQKNQKRVNVYLDGRFAFGLDADYLVKTGLKVGQELKKKEVEKLVFEGEFQKFYDRCLRLLSDRPRSEKEIRDYLKKKKAFPSLIEKIVEKLKKLKHLDDLEFAAWWVEQRAEFRPRGKWALRSELFKKGIKRELIDRVLEEKVDEVLLAKKAAEKKNKVFSKLKGFEFEKKMGAYLNRLGFSWEVVKKVLEEMKKKR